ncbi:MAG: YbhB/YbcL family Raf kinase inhibitor-like protein [Candidatus Helarchaeota archaeon]
MKITSKDFKHEEMIPPKFTCDGDDISPQLEWTDVPGGIKSFALTCVDPDAPGGDWVHWIVINIPPDVREIPQGGPVPGELVKNDFGRDFYGGPCPPSGVHRYYFTLSALKVAKLEGVKRKNFLKKIKDVTIDSAIIMGKYSRKR